MSVINLLDRSVIDHIYYFMEDDKHACASWGATCKSFRLIYLENERYIALAHYVLENYTLCANTLGHLPLWMALKTTSVILIGEMHTQPLHRKIFAQFLHRIWNKEHFVLLSESISQLTYVEDNIKEANHSWDIPNIFEAFPLIHECVQCDINILNYCKTVLFLRDAPLGRFVSLKKILKDFILPGGSISDKEKQYIEDILLALNDIIIEMEKRDEDSKYKMHDLLTIYFYLESSLMSSVSSYIYSLAMQEAQKTVEYERQDNSLVLRDQQMVRNIESQVKGGKRAIVIAGNYHVIWRENSPLEMLQEHNINFMSFCPQKEEKEQKAFKKHFSLNSPQTPRELLKNLDIKSLATLEDIYHYRLLNPLDILFEEIRGCIREVEERRQAWEALQGY